MTDGLPDLLLGLSFGDKKQQLSSSSRKSKDEFVSNTISLRIAGFKPSWSSKEPAFNVKSLLRNGDWSLVALNPEQRQKHQHKLAARELERFKVLTEEHERMCATPPFAKLEKLVLGQRGVHVVHHADLNEEEGRLALSASVRFDYFVGILSPRFTCSHSDFAETPYGLTQGRMWAPSNVGSSIVTRHMYGKFTDRTIVAGVKNRWTAYPGALNLPDPMVPVEEIEEVRVINRCLNAARRHDSYWELSDTTSVDIYGPCMRQLYLSPIIPFHATIYDKLKCPPRNEQEKANMERIRIAALRDEARARRVEEEHNAYFRQELNTKLKESGFPGPAGWVDKFDFLAWKDTPICESCGCWEPRSFREEHLEFVPPDLLEMVERMWGPWG